MKATAGNEENEEPVNSVVVSCTYEDIIKDLGPFGKFQFVQISLCLVSSFFTAFMAIGFVFIGYTPTHVCKAINETEILSQKGLQKDSTASVSYGSCRITVSTNQSGLPTVIDSFSCPYGRNFIGGKHLTLVSEWDLVCEAMGRAEVCQTMFVAGQIVGGFFTSAIADRFGRKLIMVVCSIICTCIEFSISFSPNIYVIWGLLFIDGVIFIGFNSCAFVLGLEYLRPKHRENLGVVMNGLWVFCVLIVCLFGYIFQNLSWRYFQAAGSCTGLLLFLYPFLLCESPRWLVAKNRSDEALAILKKACQMNEIDFAPVKERLREYIISQQTSVMPQQNSKNGPTICGNSEETVPIPTVKHIEHYLLLHLFRNKYACIVFCISWYMWVTHNVTYYGIYMTSSSLSGNRFVNFCILAIVEIPSNLVILYMYKRMGRLIVMRLFLGAATSSLLASSLCVHFSNASELFRISSKVLFIIGKFSITCSFNTLFILTPEIFPTVVRSSSFGACKSMSRIGSLVAPYFRPLYELVPWAPGVIFSGMCVIALIITPILPETKDQTLPTTIEDMTKFRRPRKVDNKVKSRHTKALT